MGEPADQVAAAHEPGYSHIADLATLKAAHRRLLHLFFGLFREVSLLAAQENRSSGCPDSGISKEFSAVQFF